MNTRELKREVEAILESNTSNTGQDDIPTLDYPSAIRDLKECKSVYKV